MTTTEQHRDEATDWLLNLIQSENGSIQPDGIILIRTIADGEITHLHTNTRGLDVADIIRVLEWAREDVKESLQVEYVQ